MDATEEQLVLGGQAPVESSQTKNVCGTCGVNFTRQRNLRNHEESKHPGPNTSEAAAKHLNRTTVCNTKRRERRVNDPVYREKKRQLSETNRAKKKARVVDEARVEESGGDHTDVNATDVSISVETEADKQGDGTWDPTDGVAPTINMPFPTLQFPTTAPIVEVLDGIGGVGERVTTPHKKAKTTGVLLRVETTALTTENVISFFTPKYDAPRSKAERAANPRPSAI